MKKSEVEHILRAATRICQDNEFIIIGSQSLHGKYPNLADEILMSQEVDIIAKNRVNNTDFLNVIGIDSPFHVQFGYYADPVELSTATLPKKWKNRLVNLKIESDANGAKAYCLEPHDLVVAKLAAGREKDLIFIGSLIDRGLVNKETIAQRIEETTVPQERKERMTNLFLRLVKASEKASKSEVEQTIFIMCERATLGVLESFGVTPGDYDEVRGGVCVQSSAEVRAVLKDFAADFKTIKRCNVEEVTHENKVLAPALKYSDEPSSFDDLT